MSDARSDSRKMNSTIADEQRALGEVVEHRVERGVDEVGAVVERRRCGWRSGRNRVSSLALAGVAPALATTMSSPSARASSVAFAHLTAVMSPLGAVSITVHGPV